MFITNDPNVCSACHTSCTDEVAEQDYNELVDGHTVTPCDRRPCPCPLSPNVELVNQENIIKLEKWKGVEL